MMEDGLTPGQTTSWPSGRRRSLGRFATPTSADAVKFQGGDRVGRLQAARLQRPSYDRAMQIAREELRKLPYLDPDASDGSRLVSIAPYWNGQRWHVWVPHEGRLIEMHPRDAMQTNYLAKEPASETDVLIPFVDFMWQRAGWAGLERRVEAIEEDFRAMAASGAQVRAAFDGRKALGTGVAASFAATQIEHLVTVARSVFDLLQETIRKLWGSCVELRAPPAEAKRKARALPEKFASMVLVEKSRTKTAREIEDAYAIPSALAEEYARQAPFFASLRGFRDDVVHGLTRTPFVFETDRGFCVNPAQRPFRDFAGWTEAHRFNDNLVSIVPWIAHVVLRTIEACGALILALATQIRFPPEMAPGHRVFMRAENNRALIHLAEVANGGSPWLA